MTKEDINTFHDHGDHVLINLSPWWSPATVSNALIGGVFIGMILDAVVGISIFTYFIK